MSKLLFVYNAKSDILNSTFYFAHKIISPNTYNCSLCKLTHGNFREKKEWNDFKKNSSHELEFLHVDEFEAKHEREQYPAIFEVSNTELKSFINTEEINEINSTEELISLIKNKLN